MRRGIEPARFFFRRMSWLFVFGVLHALFLWEGDILACYAVAGLLIYPIRNRSPRTLLLTGMLVLSLPNIIDLISDEMSPPQSLVEPSSAERDTLRMERHDRLRREESAYQGGYWRLFRYRLGLLYWLEIIGNLTDTLRHAAGTMILGMGMMTLGVFSATRSLRWYRKLGLLGFGIGLPCTLLSDQLHGGRLILWASFGEGMLEDLGALFLALGYVGVVMMACRANWMPATRRRLAAVGRMALTNYLMQSVMCATVFYGWGFSFWQKMSFHEVGVVVLGIWTLQMLWSPVWLRRFPYGPTERMWRLLTYPSSRRAKSRFMARASGSA